MFIMGADPTSTALTVLKTEKSSLHPVTKEKAERSYDCSAIGSKEDGITP
jgi:hypothetical protein